MLMKREFLTNKICNCGLKEHCASLGALYRHDIQAQGYDVLFIMIWCDRAITDAETSLLQKTERFPFSVLQGTDITRSTKKMQLKVKPQEPTVQHLLFEDRLV
ncbi:succinate dehydrogenase assembly factor 1, mitochondrial isoform X7 [Ambystoma mexicanum]|uniref:succinate dehydrogenase assembly factor 1, mitochondrial isoform X7 n=1 Tax=Ambystoma mexicanum TaxID=8296 RepID=UPI0037E8EAB2